MSSHEISAPWDRLFTEARENADSHLIAAIRATDTLPKGLDRTALAVAHVRAAQFDFATAAQGIAAQKIAEALDGVASALRDVASSLEADQ